MIIGVIAGLLALLSIATIGWVKAWSDAKEWATVATVLGREHERMQVELYQTKSVEQRSMWLN